MKWLWIIVLAVVGVIAAVFAFEYLTVGIGHLPSWVPGHAAHKRGHLHKNGAVAALIAVVAFAGAGWLIYKNQRTAKPATPPADPQPATPSATPPADPGS
jgi:uncharacterized membrane protein YebE (DUF533 family)